MVALVNDALLKLQIFVGVPGEPQQAFGFIPRSATLRRAAETRQCPRRPADLAASDRRHDLGDDVETMVQVPFNGEGDLQVVLLSRVAGHGVEEVEVGIKVNEVFARNETERVIMTGRTEIRIGGGGPPDQSLCAESRSIPSFTKELVLDRRFQIAQAADGARIGRSGCEINEVRFEAELEALREVVFQEQGEVVFGLVVVGLEFQPAPDDNGRPG